MSRWHNEDVLLQSYLYTSAGDRWRVGLYLHVNRVAYLQRKAHSGRVVWSLCASVKSDNRLQFEALGNNYSVCGVYSPEPRSEVYCVRLNFNISKLVYLRKGIDCIKIQFCQGDYQKCMKNIRQRRFKVSSFQMCITGVRTQQCRLLAMTLTDGSLEPRLTKSPWPSNHGHISEISSRPIFEGLSRKGSPLRGESVTYPCS